VDTQQWDAWLALFEEGAEYWIPSWDSEHEFVTDPHEHVSLMYYADRTGLEDRVFRIRTERSAASTPLPRTCHLVSNVLISGLADGTLEVSAHWVTHLFRSGVASHFFGRYEYLLAPWDADWRIRRKKVLVYNDTIPTVLDIYSV
jgi:3-phenylpropionate/cinnamic acid dioxygenase small subunit